MLVRPRGPFSLQASLDLLARFAPAGARNVPGTFLAEPHVIEGQVVTVRAEQREDGAVEVSPDAAAPLVRRMLCLDWDGDAFAALPDPVLAAVREAHPGLRPVLFATPWEAGAWALIGHRIVMTQGARIKDRIRDRLGPRPPRRWASRSDAAAGAAARDRGARGVWGVASERWRPFRSWAAFLFRARAGS